MHICEYCNKGFEKRLSMTNHRRCCINNPSKMKPNSPGLNQYSKAKLLGLPIPTSSQKGKPGKGTPHSDKFKDSQRLRALERNLGGVRPSKRIVYNNKILGSTYELMVAKSLDEHNIEWTTCGRFEYIDPFGKTRTYTPDIYLPQFDVYLDPKNDFLINNINPKLGFTDKEKVDIVVKMHNIRVVILNKCQLSWDIIKNLLD